MNLFLKKEETVFIGPEPDFRPMTESMIRQGIRDGSMSGRSAMSLANFLRSDGQEVEAETFLAIVDDELGKQRAQRNKKWWHLW